MNHDQVDPDKARILSHYIALATRKFSETNEARLRYEDELQAITRQTAEKYHYRLGSARQMLEKALAREKALLQEQKADRMITTDLQKKIDLLMHKLERVSTTEAGRSKRIAQLDSKVDQHYALQQQTLEELRANLRNLEKLYKSIPHRKKYAEQLLILKKRIQVLKREIKNFKKK